MWIFVLLWVVFVGLFWLLEEKDRRTRATKRKNRDGPDK